MRKFLMTILPHNKGVNAIRAQVQQAAVDAALFSDSYDYDAGEHDKIKTVARVKQPPTWTKYNNLLEENQKLKEDLANNNNLIEQLKLSLNSKWFEARSKHPKNCNLKNQTKIADIELQHWESSQTNNDVIDIGQVRIYLKVFKKISEYLNHVT